MSSWGNRVCAGCGTDLKFEQFSKNQWSKPVGVSRCRLCVSEGIVRNADDFGTARHNHTTKNTWIEVDLSRFDEQGAFRYCTYGFYRRGPRSGQRCVAKWFKSCRINENDFFNSEFEAVERALRIITQFNMARFASAFFRLNQPEEWIIDNTRCLVEPYIENYRKFNSNTGWYAVGSKGGISESMQALSHFSYHITSGMLLLCDLQGGMYRDGVVLTDPVIISRTRRFGPTDLGPQGMSSFFYYHKCNRFCKSEWTQPKVKLPYHHQSSGTSMEFFPTRRFDKSVPSGGLVTYYEHCDDIESFDDY